MFHRILVTGGAGFIGSNLVRFLRKHRPNTQVVNLDAFTYSGNPDNLTELAGDAGHRLIAGDITDPAAVDAAMAGCDAVMHLAAESHVDRSILDSRPFVVTNVVGTQVLIDAALRLKVKRFLQVSTDEVYGSLPLDRPELKFTEATPLAPNSPYSASKAGADLLVRAFHETHGLNVGITRCSNNFGPRQFPEKVIPLFVSRLLDGKKVPLYGDGKNVRDWLHVDDHCDALLAVLERGKPGAVYNIGGENERTNLELTRTLLALLGKDERSIEHVPDRLGHDRRYAVDISRIRSELGWTPIRSAWPAALESTVAWYVNNREWTRRILTGQYRGK